jgi:hypothetical protein
VKLADFRDSFRDELGEQLYEIVGDGPFERWVNVGQRRLGSFLRKTTPITWASGATEIALPTDFHHADEYLASGATPDLPPGRVWGTVYLFNAPATIGGQGKLLYYAKRPDVIGNVESTLDEEGNEALISYGLYRFFKRLASSRADYRMYATITQQNGVDIAELDQLSERHLQDFKDSADSLTILDSTSYYDN